MNTVHNYYCTVFNRKLKELSMIFSVFVTISTNILLLSNKVGNSGTLSLALLLLTAD